MDKIIRDAIDKANDNMQKEVDDSVHASMTPEMMHQYAKKTWFKLHNKLNIIVKNKPISNTTDTFSIYLNPETKKKYVASYAKNGALIDFKLQGVK